ncbi:MAG: ABC transporter permease subunit [Myxococcales bacterium]|nr:ABC transporter permease subunit [Myxococcales bacterium]
MRGLRAALAKEWLELRRTHRLTVLAVLFVLIGLGSPLLAALTPELLSGLAGDELGGMELILTREPSTTDALFQYHKNYSLLPLVVILSAAGAVAGERARGTAAMALARPLSRSAFIVAKALALALALTLGTLLAAAGALLYTQALFGAVELAGFALVNGLLLLLLLFYVALTLAASVIAPGPLAAAGIGLGGLAVVAITGMIPLTSRLSPAGLSAAALDLLLGREPVVIAGPVVVTLALTTGLLALALAVFRRQEI